MSTILKTLKKLEEEKSVLEKNNDLKGLVLQGETGGGASEESGARSRRTLWGGLLLGGFVLGVATYFLIDRFAQEPPPVPTSRPVSTPVPETQPPVKTAFDHPTGIPLSHIRDTSPYADDPVFPETEWIEPEAPPLLETAAPKPIDPPIAAPRSVDGAVEKIDSLIKSVTTQAYLLREDPAEPEPLRSETHIPGLRVKGIVYFADNHPANHIYIATPSESNVKLKVDETEQRAILKAILPNKAVFVYQGKRVELAMGE